MAKEIMKAIKGLPDYYVTNTGKIYSTKVSPRYNPKGELRLVKPHIHKLGYLYANLFVGKGKTKKRVSLRIHRLVVEAFVGKIRKGLTVDHLDFNKQNNDISNLEVVTRAENLRRYHKAFNHKWNCRNIGHSHSVAKNYIIAYDSTGKKVGEYYCQAEAARQLNISAQSIYNCNAGRAKSAGGYTFELKPKQQCA